MQTDAEAATLDEARTQLAAAHQAAAAAAALEAARRDPIEEQRKQNASLARAFKAEHFSGAGGSPRAKILLKSCVRNVSRTMVCL